MEQQNGDDPLVTSSTMPKTTENWLTCPEEPTYRSSWNLGDFFERPYNWKDQEKVHDEQMKTYELDKKNYDIFCEGKIAQIPPIKHLSTRQVIQKIEKRKLDARQAKFAEHDFDRRYTLPEHMRPKQLKRAECPFNSPTPAHNNKIPSDMYYASP